MAKKSSTKQKLSTALKRYWNTKGRARRRKRGGIKLDVSREKGEREHLLSRGSYRYKNTALDLVTGKKRRRLLTLKQGENTNKPLVELLEEGASKTKSKIQLFAGKNRKLFEQKFRKHNKGKLSRKKVYQAVGVLAGTGALGLVLSRPGVRSAIASRFDKTKQNATQGFQEAIDQKKREAVDRVMSNAPAPISAPYNAGKNTRQALNPAIEGTINAGKWTREALNPAIEGTKKAFSEETRQETKQAVDNFIKQSAERDRKARRDAQAAVLKAQRRDRRARKAAQNKLNEVGWKLRGWLPFSLYEQNLAEFKRRSARRGKPLSAAHKRKISESLKRKYGGGRVEDSAGSTARTLEAIARAGESASRAAGNLARAQRIFKTTRQEYSPLGRAERLLRGGGLSAIGTLGAAGIRTGGQLRGARIRAGSVLDASRTAAAARNRASDAIVAAARWRYKAAKQNRKTKGIAQVIRVIREVRK